jgi:site-specific recombinase XerD
MMFEGGANPRAVQKLLGHSTLDVTMRYADAVEASRKEAVSVFDRPRPALRVIDGGKAATG